ncbi:regulator of nonsense transcripts 3B-like [Contarinia nasturtii]|uniref:regulator of nonsense transcripts 3B-like n=1 Tax=Contarinia nasturtii TaxID=265458 RepID=UPI0012D3A0FC|nr:regulator of nonsense transcripts 3B-like [Contarinia nasturtii]
MSLEENSKEEPELAQNTTENQTKQLKDRKSRKDKVKPLAKVVIRRLPPTMTEDEFVKQIEPIPDHDYFYFVAADWSLGVNATCRAYVNFCNQNDIFIFRDKFDGYVFVDNKGTEYPAVVEFAPFQGLPKGKSRKKDHKASTIENEQHYLTFLESLKEDETEGKSELKMEYSFQIKDDQKITSTPLLEYLANVRQERRDERKRKIEDKKRQREEEKQRKKVQLAKSMPKTIEEDAKENDDGIIVRTIKSRPLDRDRNKNSDGNKEKSENSRAEREKQRNKERQARRKEERERNRKEREKIKDEKKVTIATAAETDQKDSKNDKDGTEKVKKYSESRRDRKRRNESNSGVKSSQSKSEQKESNEAKDSQADTTPRSTSNDDSRGNNAESKQREKEQKDRSITNLRNKDRPSLQIYQPGKRRTNSLTTSEDPTTPENESTTINLEKPSKSHENRKRSDAKESSKSDDSKKLSNEKRISRYSEKRNKAKEKRDLTDYPATDCIPGLNNDEKNNDVF